MQVSSAKEWSVVEGWLGLSAVYTEYRIGDRILPRGTPLAWDGWRIRNCVKKLGRSGQKDMI